MYKEIVNTSTEKLSQKNGLELFESNRDKYRNIFMLYNFVGYNYHRVVQMFKDDDVILYDILSKIPIEVAPESEDRCVSILVHSFRIRKDTFIVVQNAKIDWNLIFKIINIFKMREIENTDLYKTLVTDLSRVNIEHTINQIIEIIPLVDNKNSDIDQRARGRKR